MCLAAGPARAQEASLLEAWGAQLGDERAETRARAWEQLSGLPDEALPTIRASACAPCAALSWTRRPPPRPSASFATAWAAGARTTWWTSRRGCCPGSKRTGTGRPSRWPSAWRCSDPLERIGSTEAYQGIWDLFGHDLSPFRWEAKRVLHRAGERALPALILGRQHGSPDVRRLCRRGVADLGLTEAGPAVQRIQTLDSPTLLADLLRAYAEARLMDAMPLVVSFVDDPDADLRAAARGRHGDLRAQRHLAAPAGPQDPPR